MLLLRSVALKRAAALASVASSSSSSTAPTCLRTFASSSARQSMDPQLGEYPDIPIKSYQLRKHDKTWFDPQEKRNFGETPAEQDDILSVWAPDLHENIPPALALRQFLLAAGAFGAFFAIVYHFTPEPHFIRRVYPREGLAEELSGPAKAYKQGCFDQKGEDDDE